MTTNDTPILLDERTTISLLGSTRELDVRAAQLARQFTNEHQSRVELAAICHLRDHGEISVYDLYTIACESARLHLRRSTQEDLNTWVYRPCGEVWRHLESLVADNSDVLANPPDDLNLWYKTIMRDLGYMLSGDVLNWDVAVSLVPRELVETLRARTTRDLLDGVFGTGATLHRSTSGEKVQ